MSAPDEVYKLVEKFDREKPGSETEVRIQFVDPLYSALGWDMRDKRQVRHEPSFIMEEEGLKRKKKPDYSFHIGNARHFFVETKMPHINLERNPIPAFQLRRYGWTGQTLVSVLTDFEEFSVYDCRIKPERSDPANRARLRYYQYGDYIDKWDEFEARFSREAVAGGALREWIEGERVRGLLSVDQSFLRDMEKWRDMLAKAIALHNSDLSQRKLNLLVQRTIDRIVFLRIAEDRNIEAYRRLRSAADDGKQVYEALIFLFHEADDKYNSGLFHFGEEKRASDPDLDSLEIHIPDEPLREIIRNLYFPFSPYEFSVISAEILGQVYEQFLGKVIELSAGGAVRVEEKPEVRKAGGVYYTPAYIVDYIVENTVGDLLWGKTPAEAEKLRILDPACGSGSFLTGAYQYLLDWHLEYYSNEPERHKNVLRRVVGGWVLTTAEKRRILQNNIYGVDLDQNAVEVSKLSLLLKMLENELENEDDSDATGRQTIMFSADERILPDLSDNIKWGNSLIGSDFYDEEQSTHFTEEERLRIKFFDWDSEDGFGEIVRSGGFHAVIGNPPYRKERDSKELLQELRHSSYGRKYYEGKMDLWYFFLHRALDVVAKRGLISFIVSSYWITSTGASRLINRLPSSAQFRKVVDFAKNKIFNDVGGNHMVFVLEKHTVNSDFTYLRFTQNGLSGSEIARVLKEEDTDYVELQILSNRDIYTADGKINFQLAGNVGILEKLSRESFQLQDHNKWFEVSQGVVEATDLVSPKLAVRAGRLKDTGKGIFVISGKELQEKTFTQIEKEFLKKYLRISDVDRYRHVHSGFYLLYIGNKENQHIKQNRDEYANLVAHLDYFEQYITSSNKPYGIHRTRKPHFFNREKLLCPNMFDKPNFTYCLEESYVNLAFNVVVSWQDTYSLKYVLGIMNSTLGAFWFNLLGKKRGVNVDIGVGVIRQFPIRTIDFDNPTDKAMHDKMVALADAMLNLHKQLPGLVDEGRRIVNAQIARTDRKIDELVYRLYGLTDDEVAIVEGG